MNIAIIHYHLNRGGVTQVVRNHLEALDSAWDSPGTKLPVALLHGGRSSGWQESESASFKNLTVSTHALSELDYDNERPRKGDLTSELTEKLQKIGFKPADTVLHLHNHALGKNIELPLSVHRLAKRGFACLLQIHDFAEDFRADQYQRLLEMNGKAKSSSLPAVLYPQAPQIHYAVLNRRDECVLRSAGIDDARLYLVPNPVAGFQATVAKKLIRSRFEEQLQIPIHNKFFVYPVRGIRRKNLGEAILWSAMANEKTSFAMTLVPQNPQEQTSYNHWVQLAQKLDLNWHFELGQSQFSFPEILNACDCVLTTSVCEGFGLAFLEAFLAGRQIVGRDLPEITADYVEAGIKFPMLLRKVRIPIEFVDKDKFVESFIAKYKGVMSSFNHVDAECSVDHLRRSTEGLLVDGSVDFAYLNCQQQTAIIEKVRANDGDRETLLQLNPKIAKALTGECDSAFQSQVLSNTSAAGSPSHDAQLISQNAAIIRDRYSVSRIGNQLLEIYQQLVASHRVDQLEPLPFGERILESFLDIERFHPIRVESQI